MEADRWPSHLTLDGANTSTATFVALDDGVYTFELSATGAGSDSDEVVVTVNNLNPVAEAGNDRTVDVLVEVSLEPAATFTDIGTLDTHTATIDWGDETTDAGVVTEANGVGSVAASHIYEAPGIFTVTVSVQDDDGGIGTAELTLTVTGNVPPVAVITGNETANEGDVVDLDGSGSFDPGSPETIVLSSGTSATARPPKVPSRPTSTRTTANTRSR